MRYIIHNQLLTLDNPRLSVIIIPTEKQRTPAPWSVMAQNALPEYRN